MSELFAGAENLKKMFGGAIEDYTIAPTSLEEIFNNFYFDVDHGTMIRDKENESSLNLNLDPTKTKNDKDLKDSIDMVKDIEKSINTAINTLTSSNASSTSTEDRVVHRNTGGLQREPSDASVPSGPS